MAPRNKCGSCDTCFAKGEKYLTCNACKNKYHEKCSQLNDNELDVIMKKTKLQWFCEICNDDVVDMICNFEKFRKVAKEIEKMKNEMNSKINEFEKRVTLIESGSSAKSVSEKIEKEVKKTNEQDKEELELIRSKEKNLVYFNLPESNSEDTSDKMLDDFKLLNEAYKNEIKQNQISNLFRVGKKTDKIRPLIVKYNTLEDKNEILKKSGYLTIKSGNEVRPIFVSIDRTINQRESHKKLVKELKERRDNGEENIVIRNDKIITNFQKEKAAERVTWASVVENK